MRTESDSKGTIEVPDEVHWGAQTARSLTHLTLARIERCQLTGCGILKAAAE